MILPSARPAPWRAVVVAGLAALLLGGCHAMRHKQENLSPEALYQRGSKAVKDGNFDLAVKVYENLTAKYPFSDPARQSRIDLMYVYYRKHEKEAAVDAADTFMRENPTHPRIDYAYYIKGLVYFERDPNFLERWLNVDLSRRPPQDLRKSFEAFSHVVTQFPQSAYAADARQRMVYLRNRLAEYEVHVAEYYMRRGAYVAAIDRCRYVLENYDGAPSMRPALAIIADAYGRLGMPELAADTNKVLAANFPAATDATGGTGRKPWWKFW